jgi:hypothetical protein
MLTLVVENQPNGPFTHFWGKLVRCLAHDAPSYSGVGASGKPGAVQTPHQGDGFTTEYVIQHSILANWEQTPWAGRYDVVQAEYYVDGGFYSRRIDILARERSTGDWLIIELSVSLLF